MHRNKKLLKKLSKRKLKETAIAILIFVCVAAILAAYFYKEKEDQKIPEEEIVATKEFRIIIPDLGVNEKVYEGKDEETLNKGPAHYPDTAFPKNKKGNVVISGHAAKTKEHGDPFGRVDELWDGDMIYLSKEGKLYKYQVTESKVVASTEMSVIDPTKEPTLTLITCIKPNYPRSKRLIIVAEKVS